MSHKIPLDITMFGQFSISHTIGGKTSAITDQTSASQRVWAFLEYLICYRSSPVTQDQLIDALWNDEEIKDPSNTLKTLLHRARRLLESIGIEDAKLVLLYRQGSYSWSDQVVFSIDTERFEQFYAAAVDTESDKLSTLLSAISLYGGALLPKETQATWVISLRMYYQARFMQLSVEAALLLEQECRFVDMIDICRKALHEDPYDESLHLLLMQALTSNGSQQSAIEHYAHITQFLMERLGISPSEQLTSFFRKLIKSTNSVELDLQVVRNTLAEKAPLSTPYYCEYAIFQDIYRLECRTTARTGQVIQLSLLSILPAPGKKLSTKQTVLSMERLKQIISTTLRQGDAFTQFSASQYLILLPCANFENGNKVLQRLISKYNLTHPSITLRLQFSVLPLDPDHMKKTAIPL